MARQRPDLVAYGAAVLTEREREILMWIALGNTNYEIARALVVSEETVKSHVKHILAKLEAKNRTHAVFIAASHGWLSTSSEESTSSRSPQSLYE